MRSTRVIACRGGRCPSQSAGSRRGTPAPQRPAAPHCLFDQDRIPVQDLNVIDRFLEVFIQYIDSGFGLLGGDVAFLTTVLIGIDITLAGLFWSLEPNDNVIGKLLVFNAELIIRNGSKGMNTHH